VLKTGSIAPEFILPDESGLEVSLTELLQDGPLVLYFYPADFTPGCTKEACSIRDIHDDIAAVGLQVVGISPQDGDSHKRFRTEHKLPFRLLSDTEKVAIKMYDVDGPFGVGVRRVTYLISQGKKIQAAVQADVMVGRHTEFVQKAIILRETAGMRRSDGGD
jgi:peroxiredoxin Q/BCP